MKRLLIPLLVLSLIALAVPAFAQVELGISYTPVPGGQTVSGGTMVDSITGFHVGYKWSVLFLSWDSLAMPSALIQNMTGTWNGSQYVAGPYLPGFLNLYDAGLELTLGPVLLYTEVGTNNIYVYQGKGGGDFGANLRLGAGLKFGWWGLNLSGTAVFNSFTQMTDTLKLLASSTTQADAISKIGENLVPSINLTFYF